jgi:hypothetical protein
VVLFIVFFLIDPTPSPLSARRGGAGRKLPAVILKITIFFTTLLIFYPDILSPPRLAERGTGGEV